ncbi:hypothetical protein QO010_002886 [Caulobacter ginsengisoli]|uniref:Uncharacterized protein n=1 Tax=Caulobacter ginsengisoli TaxID=400775 RepID=A0ABU0ISW7_9CAUL|nr:hypothetical protein [Caulobacter ginsengisoli]MDQ0465102.1 hypothetical protein [Caulobacter ginsengisoli]
MAGNLDMVGLALAGAVGAFALVALRRRRPATTAPAVIGVDLMTLRAVVLGMEVAASHLVRGASVECLGDYRSDPRRLVVEVLTRTEADADRLIAEGGLDGRLRELLGRHGYPAGAIAEVGLTIRSQQRLEREAAALREQEDLSRWAD